MFEPEVNRVFERAMRLAMEEQEPTLGSERLVHTLLQEQTVRHALERRGIDIQIVGNRIEGHLRDQAKRKEGTALTTDPNLQSALQRLAIRHMVSTNRRISSLDFLSVIVEQDASFAATVLIQQGFTVDEATDAATERFIAETQRANAELNEIRTRIARDEGTEDLFIAGSSAAPASPSEIITLDYKLIVTSRDPVTQVEFKGAISLDGRLKLLIEKTPYEIEFVSTRVVALLEAVTGSKGISAKLVVRHEDGTETGAGGFGGDSGAIFQDPRDHMSKWKTGRF